MREQDASRQHLADLPQLVWPRGVDGHGEGAPRDVLRQEPPWLVAPPAVEGNTVALAITSINDGCDPTYATSAKSFNENQHDAIGTNIFKRVFFLFSISTFGIVGAVGSIIMDYQSIFHLSYTAISQY